MLKTFRSTATALNVPDAQEIHFHAVHTERPYIPLIRGGILSKFSIFLHNIPPPTVPSKFLSNVWISFFLKVAWTRWTHETIPLPIYQNLSNRGNITQNIVPIRLNVSKSRIIEIYQGTWASANTCPDPMATHAYSKNKLPSRYLASQLFDVAMRRVTCHPSIVVRKNEDLRGGYHPVISGCWCEGGWHQSNWMLVGTVNIFFCLTKIYIPPPPSQFYNLELDTIFVVFSFHNT